MDGNKDDIGINDLAFLGTEVVLTEKLIELGKQQLHYSGFCQFIAEAEDGGGIVHLGSFANTEEPGKQVAIENLVLLCLIGEVVHRLEDKDLE